MDSHEHQFSRQNHLINLQSLDTLQTDGAASNLFRGSNNNRNRRLGNALQPTTSQSHRPIISLSKLKSYMPQNRVSNDGRQQSSSNHLTSSLTRKPTSPSSSRSSPSPKMSTMHQTTASQQTNQLILSQVQHSSANTPQLHLDHLNQHYMNNGVSANSLNQQTHPMSHHHYAYSQPATSGSGQHHLTVQDQGYTGHQQHQIQQQHPQQHQHHQHQAQHQQQLPSIQEQQSIYDQLTNTAVGVNVNVNNIYANSGNHAHYQPNLQSNNHQQNHLMQGSHQNHLNSAAAACAAAAVVSQTLKTVANQHHSQQHHYGNQIATGFGSTAGGLMNMTAQHHQQFHSINQLNHPNNQHLGNTNSINQHSQHPTIQMHHTSNIVTRKYQCKICPQIFMSKAELKYHNQNHMREAKPYKCLQCPKAFANSSYLSQHMRIHQGVKPYTCDICLRKFTQLSHLQQHKRTHTGDKPYKCNYMNCTKQFSQLSNLQSHSRCHQLDKPYKCNSCYKCYHDEQSLLEHIPRHLESKHLKKNLCIFCGSSYQQERGLVKHFQQYHTDKSPTLVAAAIAAGTTGNTTLISSLVSNNSSNVFTTPSNGGSSSSSSSSSTSSATSGSLHVNLDLGNNVLSD